MKYNFIKPSSNFTLSNQEVDREISIHKLKELYDQGNLDEVILIGEHLAERYPNVLAYSEILGAAYLLLGEEDKTIEFYQKTLEINPKHTDACNNIGIVFHNQSRLKEAVASFQKAVEIEPNFADAHYNLGNALTNSGKLQKAIESYKTCLAMNPDDAEVLSGLGIALGKYGDFDRAIECFCKAVKIAPHSTSIQLDLDDTIKTKAEIDNLVFDFAQTKQLSVESAELLNFIAHTKHKRGFLYSAIDNYNASLKIKKECHTTYFNIGTIYKEIEDFDQALNCLREAIKIKPDYAKAYNFLGAILSERGDFDAAIPCCNKALELQTDAKYAVNTNLFKVHFRYLSIKNLAHQNIYSHVVAVKNGQEAIGILKDRLKGGMGIRIDRVEDISLKFQPSFVENLKRKSRSELLLIFLLILLIATFLFSSYKN